MINKKDIVCLICCRGGSKSIKKKNIKIFNNKPLLYWSLKSIFDAKIFTKVILSTDSLDIVRVAKKFKNIIVPGLRPKQLAQSNSDQFKTHKFIFNKFTLFR